ncbi:uncharacterized protein LOC141691276 [Apium graveolens]|uniref:uncharacterized protein LOC141691276 n=1 Tax=Apium graveolens TaxID=4045 RepID=UPI003D7B4807
MVAIDYFTKWIEVKVLVKITTKQISQFFWENVICRFGIPRILVTDNGRQFDDEEFKNYSTPFMLAHGAKAVVPLEITNGLPRVEAYEPKTNEEDMRLALDLIDEVRDEANGRNAEHQHRPFLYYNRRVKERFFNQGDLVLRKIEASGVG